MDSPVPSDVDSSDLIYLQILYFLDRNIRKLPLGDDEVDDIPHLRRETMVMSHPENTPRVSFIIIDNHRLF